MVLLSTCLLLSTLFLLAQISHVAEANCPGDHTGSGCYLCEGSELRKCWDTALFNIGHCQITDDLVESTKAFCVGYAKLADCWHQGLCCSEFAPLLAAATNLCNLKTWPQNQITKEILEHTVSIAQSVQTKVWHNHSGQDVPKLSVTVKAYNTNSDESSHSESSYSSTKSKKTLPNQPKKVGDSTSEAAESSYHKSNKEITSQPPKYDHEYYSQAKKSPKNTQSVHHTAKCSTSKPKKCQTKTAHQYRSDRLSHTHRSLAKRVENPLQKRSPRSHADFYKRTTSSLHPISSLPVCGEDFQGVPYPKEIAPTVAHVLSDL